MQRVYFPTWLLHDIQRPLQKPLEVFLSTDQSQNFNELILKNEK
jgi:hypothetical protein